MAPCYTCRTRWSIKPEPVSVSQQPRTVKVVNGALSTERWVNGAFSIVALNTDVPGDEPAVIRQP